MKHFVKKLEASMLAVFTCFAGFQLPSMTAYAGTDSTLAKVAAFSYTDGTAQTYSVDADATYIIELAGASGGNSGVNGQGLPDFAGGNGGYVKFSIDLKKGDTLYAYVGARGDSLGDVGASPANSNGAGSGGGGAMGARAGAGGGASELRINSMDESSRLAVAGGGGGGVNLKDVGIVGGNGGAAGSGNAQTMAGANASSYGGGGGGGYKGGASGTTSHGSVGGSNYVANNCTTSVNGTNPVYEAGYIKILRCTKYIMTLDPNSGSWQGNKNIQTFTLDQTYDVTASFDYNGGTQTWTVPQTGYYYMEGWGAGGGNDASRGGYGGYVQSYCYLEAGTVLYITVGGSGWAHDGVSSIGRGGYGGGAAAGNTGSNGNYSGTGGGETHIAVSNHNAGNYAPLTGFASYKDDVLLVAGGGAGGSASSSGQGGSVLYTGTGASYSVANGASTYLLNGVFGYGSNPGGADGGGGGGGWIGGVSGLDAAGHSAGGGASFVNTTKIKTIISGVPMEISRSIPISLTPDARGGNGYARIRYLSDTIPIPDPKRDGYTFAGWTLEGSGKLFTTNLGVSMFTYGEGTTTLTAKWNKIPGTSELMVDSNGGIFENSKDVVTKIGTYSKTLSVATPERFGYDFAGWDYVSVTENEKADTWTDPVYTYGYETCAKLIAKWTLHKSGLAIDPNGGEYNGSKAVEAHTGLDISDKVDVGTPTKTGYIFQYWKETTGSDGYLSSDGWHPGTKDGYLQAVWTPITYTIHYEANTPEGLTVKGSQADQKYTYDEEQALASNAEYDDSNGFSIDKVKFLWWNTKADGSGDTYKSGEVVKNLTDKQGDVIDMYAQWMVTYTVNHYKENLDGTFTLADTDEYKLVPLTKWTAPLHTYAGWDQPESKEITVSTQDTTVNINYPLHWYNLTYDTQGGEWYMEQTDGTWNTITAPPAKYTVLTPDIAIAKPDKVGYSFAGWTGTDVTAAKTDVVIPKGSLGDRSYTAHWDAESYNIEVPASVVFSMSDDGTMTGAFDQDGNGSYEDGYLLNNSKFPVQVTDVKYISEGDFTLTKDKTLDASNANIMNWRLDAVNGSEWQEYASDLAKGISTKDDDLFWMAQNSVGKINLSTANGWCYHENKDIKAKTQIGSITWTFGIGHRKIADAKVVNK